MADEGRGHILGTIRYVGDKAPPPLFKVIKRGMREWGVDGEPTPCQHGAFVLEEDWGTVRCGKCGDRLDPFMVLRKYADWANRFQNERERWLDARARLDIARIKSDMRRAGATDEDRAEARTFLAQHAGRWPMDTDAVHAFADAFEQRVRTRGRARPAPSSGADATTEGGDR